MDGFSRKILWLKVVKSNNNPIVPAFLYLEAVKRYGKCPDLLRTDYGTETGIMAGIQCYFQQDDNAQQYGKSVANQRIENWWSFCKRSYSSWVIDFFKDLVDDGVFMLGNYAHIQCAWFVFADLLQEELNEVTLRWNSHCIRKSNDTVVGGIPNELYFIPEKFGYLDCGKAITNSDINRLTQQRDIFREGHLILSENDAELQDYFEYVIRNERLVYPPCNWSEGKTLFEQIIRKM